MKNIFTINPDLPFLDTLAAELWERTNGDGFLLSRHVILLPTRRACRYLGNSFARIAGGKPVLLPRMRPLGDVDEEEMAFADEGDFGIPPAIAPLKRLMLLTQQVRQRDPNLSWDQATLAAEALARFLDQIQIASCDIAKLPELVEEQELAEHWQQTLLFLEIVTRNWPLILAELGCQDPALRRNQVLAAQADVWRKNPPDFPVIAAGSTGSVPATAELLDVIAGSPLGAVILPGLDRAIDNEAWDAIDDTHPQHSMKRLLEKMGVGRGEVEDFSALTCHSHQAKGDSLSPLLGGEGQGEGGFAVQELSSRVKLLSEAMRPASVTEAWRNLRGTLDHTAVAGLTRLTLDHPQEEAQVIALRLRALLESPDQTAAFVTADRKLAARVAAQLRRWGIDADDSGGANLTSLPIGAFLELLLAAASPHATASDFLALLKHPFAACGQNPALCRAQARQAEIRARKEQPEDFAALKELLLPLKENGLRPLNAHIAAHIAVAEKVAASDKQAGAARLWQGESGEDVAAWLDEWREGAADFPPISCADYSALFASLAEMKTLRATRATHPRLSILGPLEARLCDADLMILGGLNEGSWPPDAGFDPWMSRPMRKKFNLPAPEFRIGLSAHDFVQLAAAKEVMLTRSLRANGTPTVPSRFLLQIEAVLRAAGLSDDTRDALAPTEQWREWAQALDAPLREEIKPCARPQPRPPVATRPTALSVTEITTWLRNPYAIYAKHILKLKKLDELDAEWDASDRGTMIHAALEQFIRAFPDALPQDAEAQLLSIGREIFAQDKSNPRIRAFWGARFADIAAWFVDQDRKRRESGVKMLAPEAKGAIEIDGLTLTGRADRIDALEDGGSLVIIDYKTGAVPSKNEVLSGVEPQLQLLALIAAAGGFEGLAPAETCAGEYWALKGGSSGCKITVFDEELPELIAKAEAGLKMLIETFADPETAYEAAPKPRLQPKYNDYAHLSRLAEWGRTGEGG
ncbi:MAG: double-strand break repair protein AddB [Alphaproteobacteria bacterium]|nr:double-strand break repair protein AddB [Alphaproteobacteria bacterium]